MISIERKSLEICDCGSYIKIHKCAWINKSWIVGVHAEIDPMYSGYNLIITTITPDFSVSIPRFKSKDECVEICNKIMGMCCESTPKEI